MKIKIAVIAVVLLLEVSSLCLAYETWNSGWKQNKITATIHYVDLSGKKITRNFVGTYNDFEIDRDKNNHHYIWLYSTNEFGNNSGMQITVNAVGSGLSNPSGATAFLVTGGDPNLNTFANTSSFPLTLQLTPSISMDPSDVKSLLIKGTYTLNNLVGSSSPILHMTATGILTVYGNRYPGFITLSMGQNNIPPAPIGNYTSISSAMSPIQPPALNSGSVVAKNLSYNISFGNNTAFNIIKDSGANSGGSAAGLLVTLYDNAGNKGTSINTLNGSASVNASTENVAYTPNSGFSGVDNMYYVVSTNPNSVSSKYQVTVTVGPAPVAGDGGLYGTLLVEKNSTTPFSINLGNYLSNWNKNLTYQNTDPVKGILSKMDTAPDAQGNFHVGYTPNRNFGGVDYFTYKVTHTNGWVSAPGTIAVKVRPIAYDDYTTIHTTNTLQMNLLANDDTFETPTMTKIFRIYSSGMRGTVTLSNSSSIISPNITYTPNSTPGVFGNYTDTFAYTIKDSAGQTSTASVKIRTQ